MKKWNIRCKCGAFVKKGKTRCNKCETIENIERGFLDNENVKISDGVNLFTKSEFKPNKTDSEAESSTINKNKPLTIEDHVRIFHIDTDKWKAANIKTNDWDVTNGDGLTYKNYQLKINWVNKDCTYDYDSIRDEYREFAKKYAPNYQIIKYKKTKQNNLLEINIADLHLGKLCWAPETGSNWDTKIASKTFLSCLSEAIQRASAFEYSRILFPIGNDFFNSDNLYNTTTAGTPQQDDIRWQKTVKSGRELLITAIDFLSQYAPVDVLVVQGNHDFQRMFYVGDTLELWYSNSKNVTVNNSPRVRKYYQYGLNLIGFTHGKEEPIKDLPLIMAQEAPREMWASTRFREMHLGHMHKKKTVQYVSTDEHKGVVIRWMRTLSAPCEWSTKKGYVGDTRAGEAILWNDLKGVIANFEIAV